MRNATKVMASTMGVVVGLAGLEHGIGETLQGNRAPDGIMFPSWPESAFFDILAGEPAMSILPNYLFAGILTILFSLIFIVWATSFVQRKNGSLVLILLSILLLLVGGGFGPPLLGIIIGVAGTQIHAPSSGWRAHLSAGFRRFLKRLWPWVFGACILAWLLLFPGLPILGYFFGVNDPNLILIVISLAFGSLLLTIFAGFGVDSDATPSVCEEGVQGTMERMKA
ncbi:MAG: hypothetical protein M1281_19080 [Chloroflexi bacterium]|nr:hypothetical protein [Chloroflexota bacterium]